VKGRKRHVLVDTGGRALVLQAHAASIQDRDDALPPLKASRRAFPFIECAFADSAYAADRVSHATRIAVEIVRNCIGRGLPLRRFGDAPHPPIGEIIMSFEVRRWCG
jgi:hypothetical protein